MTRSTKGSSGFGILELMFAIGALAFVAIGLISLNLQIQKSSVQAALPVQMDIFRRNIAALVMSNASWDMTVSKNTSMKCLASTTENCTVGGGPTGTPLSGPFILYDATGATPFYDGTKPNVGLTATGASCDKFDGVKGNDQCPFQFQVTWTAICGVGTCAAPQVSVLALLVYKSATQPAILNPQNYSLMAPGVIRNAQ